MSRPVSAIDWNHLLRTAPTGSPDVRVESRLASNRVNLTFGDGTPVTVEMTKGLGSARKLAAAIATRMSAG